jgi:epoxyqueuosine reductase
VAVLARSLSNEIEPLVRSHAAWALGRLGGATARAALERLRGTEIDPDVSAEIEAALTAPGEAAARRDRDSLRRA